MLRYLLSFLILSFTILTPAAQTHYSSNICLGVHGGVDLSRVMFSPSIKQGWLLGPTLGLGVRYIEENHFGLIAEVNYVRRGWSENFEELPYNYSRSLDFIEIPVFAHIYFGRRAKFFANAGPQIAFRIGESTASNFDPFSSGGLPEVPNASRRNELRKMKATQKVDYGIAAGLGCEFNVNRRNSFTLEARYYFGLGNIFPAGRSDLFKASNSMYIMCTLGYWFRVK